MKKNNLIRGIAFLIISSFIFTSCGSKGGINLTTNRVKGDINYVKDNTYYILKNDGKRIAICSDDVENSRTYLNKKNDYLYGTGSNNLSGFMNIDMGKNKSLKEKFEEKNYYPLNYYDMKSGLSLVEKNYSYSNKTFNISISTESIIVDNSIKKEVNSEDEIINEIDSLLKKEKEERQKLFDSVYETYAQYVEEEEALAEYLEGLNLETDAPIDDFKYGEDDDKKNDNIVPEEGSSEDTVDVDQEEPVIYEVGDIIDERVTDIANQRTGKYIYDINKNEIIYLDHESNVCKYNISTYKREILVKNMDKVEVCGRDLILSNQNSVVLYNVDSKKQEEFMFDSIVNTYPYKDNAIIILNADEEGKLSLYEVSIKEGLKEIEKDVRTVYGYTKNNLYYTKNDETYIPYSTFLIDDISTGEFMGEEPLLKDYRLSDDELSFEFDLDKYTADRFTYKLKEKFLNDGRKYYNKYVDRVHNEDWVLFDAKLFCYDGKEKKKICDQNVINAYIADVDNDVVYFETELNVLNTPFEKRKIGDFVIQNKLIEEYFEELHSNTQKNYVNYVYHDKTLTRIHDTDFYKSYVDKKSTLYYDMSHRKSLNDFQIREVAYVNNHLYVTGNGSDMASRLTYSIDIDKKQDVFADTINMYNSTKIKFIDYIDAPVYALYSYDDEECSLYFGKKKISEGVVLDSITINAKKDKLAYSVKTLDNTGSLHRVNIKNNFEDQVVSEKAFVYNIAFDSLTDDLLYLVYYNDDYDCGILLSVDNNNKITFIDYDVNYIIKN